MVKSPDGKTEIISKEENFWRGIKKRTEGNIFEQKELNKLNLKIIEFAESQIKKNN